MSDEPEQPILRLRPRNVAKSSDNVSPPAAAPAAADSAAGTAAPRSRPKLSLGGDTSGSVALPAEPPATTEPEVTSRPKPRLSLKSEVTSTAGSPAPAAESVSVSSSGAPKPAAEAEASPAKPKLRLSWDKSTEPEAPAPLPPPVEKPKPISMSRPPMLPVLVEPESEGTLGGPEAEGESAGVFPLPIVTGGPVGSGVSPKYPAPAGMAKSPDHTHADEDQQDVEREKSMRPEQRPAFKIALIGLVVVVVLGVAAGSYYVVKTFIGSDPVEAPAVATIPTVTPETPVAVAAEPESALGAAVAQAAEVVDSQAQGEGEVDSGLAADGAAVVDGEGLDLATSGMLAEPPVPASTMNAPVVVPKPSPAFLAWVSDVKVSGVREGAQPRAFINGRLSRQGDSIDHALGIVFHGVDAERNLVIFRDGSGALVGKKY